MVIKDFQQPQETPPFPVCVKRVILDLESSFELKPLKSFYFMRLGQDEYEFRFAIDRNWESY